LTARRLKKNLSGRSGLYPLRKNPLNEGTALVKASLFGTAAWKKRNGELPRIHAGELGFQAERLE
jgi:hypothetical protein